MDKEAHRIKVIAENERLLMSNIELRRDRDNLRAENERLREALRIISASVFNDNGDVTYDTSGLFKAARIAKEALK